MAAVLVQGCFKPVPAEPTLGYGAPYQGTGQPIYVKDSRNDWEITEGDRKITTAQALEVSGDPEYAARRNAAKAYNAVLRKEAERNRRRGFYMIAGGIGVAVLGTILSVTASSITDTTTTPATATEPEIRMTAPGGLSAAVRVLGSLMMYGGIGGAVYGWWGGSRPPPYHQWRVPAALDRPAYVRQHTEGYNEKIGAPSVVDQPGGVAEEGALAPGQRRPKPPRPTPAKGVRR